MDSYCAANTVFVVFAMMIMLAAFRRADEAMYHAKNACRASRVKAKDTT